MVDSDAERRMQVLGPHVFDAVPLTRAAAAAGVPVRTAQRWLMSYAADGASGLERAGRSDVSKRRSIPAELVAIVEALALRRPPPKIAQLHREAVRIAGEKGWPAPSYAVTRGSCSGWIGVCCRWRIAGRLGIGMRSSWFSAGNRCVRTICDRPITPNWMCFSVCDQVVNEDLRVDAAS